MHRISWFVFGFLVGMAALFTSQKYHIVQAEDGIHMVPRVASGYDDIYVDVRKFEIADWSDHQSVAMALMEDGKGEIVKDAAVGSVRRQVDEFFRDL
ncbi:MAG: hypothetical protein QGG36_06125 [Pirellulaceae bacterium]|jgi:hypothetical protein|nr:hypothetical protein [Pirellulaceae bacterium]MDP7015354.1 hypothetical protein [Pirellulaceae bacterium]